MKLLLIVPYTMVEFSSSKGRRKSLCVDSYALQHLSDIARYPLIIYVCKAITKFRFSMESVGMDYEGMKVLRREVPSYDVLKYVVNAYRKLNSEVTKLRRRAKVNPMHAPMFWLSPPLYIFRDSEGEVTKLTRMSISLLLLESLLGKELLYEDPIIEYIEEFNIAVPIEIIDNSVRFLGKNSIMKIYEKLYESDEEYRKSLLNELLR